MVKVGWPSSRSVFGIFASGGCDKDDTLDKECSDDMEQRGGGIAVFSAGGSFERAREKRNGLYGGIFGGGVGGSVLDVSLGSGGNSLLKK